MVTLVSNWVALMLLQACLNAFLYQKIYFAGIEARGFLFGPSIALAIGAKFVPLRKPRKLPGMPASVEFLYWIAAKIYIWIFI